MVPMRLLVTIVKAHSTCYIYKYMIEVFSNTAKNVEYPLILHDEIEHYKQQFERKPWIMIIITAVSFLQNVPAMITAKINQDSLTKKEILINIWLPPGLALDDDMIGVVNTVQVITVWLIGYIVFGFANFFISLISLNEKMLRHLNRVLLLAQSRSNADESESLLTEEEMSDVFKYAIQHHQKCIQFVDQINAKCSTILLLDVWSFLYALCAVAYQVAKDPGIYPDVIKTLIQNIITTAMYIGFSCWHAATVTSQGLLVSANCMAINWWNYGPGLAQDISIMSSMAQVKLCFMVGPFYSLNMTTFLTILEIGLTYFILLYQIK
ncbi:Hypothetical predicted protein [Cloeon dipterum]|uniref:Odorant receptor n=1 Tax=Cloeon dipterum TaxID=197152 RepID=A0A8S1D4P8_9INSE|nr:Hypothetical predicted protein [Cloeon dipterum]